MKTIDWITLSTRIATLYLVLCIASHVGRPHISQSATSSNCDQGSCGGSMTTTTYELSNTSGVRTESPWWLP
jgi:hypothetical protein